MAILFRNTAQLTIGGMEARLTVYRSGERLRVELIPYANKTDTVYSDTLTASVTYNGETKPLAAAPFTKAVNAVFSAEAGKKSIILSSSSKIICSGISAYSHEISWKGDGTVSGASLKISEFSGLYEGEYPRLSWKVTNVPKGYRACTLGLWYNFAETAALFPKYTRSVLIDGKSAEFSYWHNNRKPLMRNAVSYRIAVGLYPEDTADTAGRDDYIEYLEIDSPVYVCSGESEYLHAPYDIRCSNLSRNRTITVSWNILTGNIGIRGVHLEVTYDGTSWDTIIWQEYSERSYLFTVPDGVKNLAFRVASFSNRSKYDRSEPAYGPWITLGMSNLYVGYNGGISAVREVVVGTAMASAVLHIGG